MPHKSKASKVKTKPGAPGVPAPPARYRSFIERFEELGQAWELIGLAGRRGPLDERQARLVKLGIALGALREGAVHASVRKALGLGIAPEEIEQVVALSAGTLGLPATVAVWSWVHDLLPAVPEKKKKSGKKKSDPKKVHGHKRR